MFERRKPIFAHADFHLDALLSLAAKLREGCSCNADVSQRPKAGSLNWAIFITFDDGVEWVFRPPRSRMSPLVTSESASKMVISEAVTLKYFGNTARPRSSGDNDIAVPYILMSKASGRPLLDCDRAEGSRTSLVDIFMTVIIQQQQRQPPLPMTDRDREKAIFQLEYIMSSLSEIHLDKIELLFEAKDDDSNYFIGECLSPSPIWQWRDTFEGIHRGPFHQESEYFSSQISAFVAHAKELPLTPHSFFTPLPDAFEYPSWASYCVAAHRRGTFCWVGDKMESSKNRLSYCIAGQPLQQMIPSLASHTTRGGGFVLSHPDLHVGNLFVDENFNITSIIDWGSVSSGPLSELLASPGFSGPTTPPTISRVAAFRDGFCRGGEMMWRFSRLVRLLSGHDYTLFKALYELVHKNPEDIPRLFHDQSTQGYAPELLAKLREDDEEDEEDDGGGHDEMPKELAIAGKLTLMSEMNPSFVADKTLWLWIENALDQANS
ncbi:hypothetical protein EDB81DRAFT_907510 [Dactylonectria macrodidyma]|uniref:Aminoglycoside phosphotransferase domain-containing protein n=1 Tax=Dactylonectria macrodidyma TaxID=307937 RepID=A0A9P9DX32_9HYPO|nr:hypothetical protein EDB81DRAFT_907510 [Dactylonectria macrodidyma]